jgi:hypothetical protein
MAATSIRVVSYHDPLVSLLDLIQCSTFSETTRKECTELVTTITNCSSSLPFSPQESLKIDSVYKHMYYKKKKTITLRQGLMQPPFDSFLPETHQGRTGALVALLPGSGKLAML